MILKFLLFTNFMLIQFSQSANILGLFSLYGSSHFQVYQPLLEKLAERGHQVDVLSHFPRENPLPGYFDYSVKGSVPFGRDFKIEQIKSIGKLKFLDAMNYNCGCRICVPLINTTAAQELMKSTKQYDVIITELFVTDCLLGYARIFKAPLIGMITSANLPWTSDLIGLPDNPSYIPNYITAYTQDMNFWERFYNAILLYVGKIWYRYYPLEESNTFIKNTFGKSEVHVKDILRNISLVMVNSHFSMHQSRPMTSNFIEIGGIHIKPKSVLEKKYEDYLATNLKGVAFLSFGTLFKSETFPDDILVSLFEALGQIPYKILWKGNKSNVAKHLKIPNNIHFIPWLPQAKFLCHPNLTFFITHCGLSSIQETIYCSKPILGIPVWADQLQNANTAVSKEIGVSVPLFDVTKQKLSNALQELLSNPKYTTNAAKASELFRDRPMPPLDTAVFWTEYIIRHKGAPHLRSKGADLSWYQYHCLDIIVTAIVIIIALLYSVYKLCTFKFRVHICKYSAAAKYNYEKKAQ